ncbi:GtrA family protein [Pseudomonas lini]|uniref:Putative flippase GtrA (Transmembrane translocase of bactoprenol-linked glucose) n=1 Tax=Pseudomonas lini TaxID=163011 RepID=A0A1H1WEK8_9PSED|nr:GtrA family protein [Pseudomonas lini]SDS95465.1 Putative flippase GtrA (transmembrane translocase of bactoprenol-linked glucose) [Pseudomonas lini]
MSITISKEHVRRWVSFLAGGFLNTLLTYGIYLLLNMYISYQKSYVIAYITGIVFSYLFNAQIVFNVKKSWKGLMAYPLVYLLQYILAALMLSLMVERLGIPKEIAPLLIIVLLLPVTYLLSKTILKATHQSKTEIDQ